MSYGVSVADIFRLAGIYTGRVLNGEKPTDLPVQRATKVEVIQPRRPSASQFRFRCLPVLTR
jgi:hypothetical protein